MDLLCGFVPKKSVETALGRTDISASGRLQKATSKNADGTTFAQAQCEVSTPGAKQPALTVRVTPYTTDLAETAMRNATVPNFYHFPAYIGIGTVLDALGSGTGSGKDAGLLRGDWFIAIGLIYPAKGRHALDDLVALVQEVIDQLKIPLKPTKPYPSPS